jgi:wyosine [tRNA(Phe)-imidazoG37] synthetase (radical SAM superfamily)
MLIADMKSWGCDLNEIRPEMAAVQDHSRHFADFTFVYPVISRRARGLSIGVNVNPDKVCNFDCVYCEVDRREPGKVSRLDLRQLRDELVAMIRFARDGGLAMEPKFNEVPWLAREIKDIAFSGEGEPTLISNFSECMQIVAEVKLAEKLDQAKIVLVTDAAGLDKADVRRGLEIMDANGGEVWGKLDAGTEDYFKQINRSNVRYERILNNLLTTALARPIVIQTLFLKMHGAAMAGEELAAYCERLNFMASAGAQIKEVHAYTIARPTPESFVSKLGKAELGSFAEVIHRNTGLRVLTFE